MNLHAAAEVFIICLVSFALGGLVMLGLLVLGLAP
jgi:hypothetical protein